MPPTLTNRELKNKTTGIDIIVPEYQIIPGKIVNTVLYHVIVITRLFYFKTRQHKESDLVQFAVAKKYEEVEDLHTKLAAKFPSVNFPLLPKMSLIVTEKALNERKKFLEQLLSLIARTPKLCSSSPVLNFLEVNKISIKQNQLQVPEQDKKKEEEKEETVGKTEDERDIFGVTQYEGSDNESDSSSDQEDLDTVDMKRPVDQKPKPSDPLAGTSDPLSAPFDQQPSSSDSQTANSTTPEKEQPSDAFLKSGGKFSFGSHDTNESDISDLFIPDEAKISDDVKLFVSDDDPDLLQIDDDLDKLLNFSKKPVKVPPSPKPRAPTKPDLKPRPTPKPRFAESTDDTDFLTKPDKPVKFDKPVKPNKPVKPDKPVKPEKPVKPVKPEKAVKPESFPKPEKPVKPEKPAKPEKPVKPDQKKPDIPVKIAAPPKPKPRNRPKAPSEEKSQETPKTKDVTSRSKTKSDGLDDIFGNSSKKADLFSGIDDDEEDLFKPAVEVEDIDDITKYIESNIGKVDSQEVDLFS